MKTHTQKFGFIGRGRKYHFLWETNGQLITGCRNAGGEYIGKPVSLIGPEVSYNGNDELDDEKLAVAELIKLRPHLNVDDICKWCHWGRYL